MSYNKVLLIGNVGRDPEVRHLETGVAVATVTLATTERYKDKNGQYQDLTEWHTIVCWRNLAELAEKYINKGSQIFVEGRIRTRNWTDQNGQKRYTTEILADNIRLLGRRADAQGAQDYSASQPYSAPTQQRPVQGRPAVQNNDFSMGGIDEPTDDLPF